MLWAILKIRKREGRGKKHDQKLMQIFTFDPRVIAIGQGYLWIEGTFYILIGILFLFYGYYRAVNRPGVSVVLTVISLGIRVLLA